jgi:hypothetical protein
MIGSVLAVHVTTMSNSCSRCGNSLSVIACGAQPVRELAAAVERAVRDGDGLGLLGQEMTRGELDHLARADQQQALACDRRKDALGELDAGGGHRDRGAADVGLRAHVLGDRERALEEAIRMRPSDPADSADRTACFIWPRICGSPSTIESSPLATRNACVTAFSCGSVYTYGAIVCSGRPWNCASHDATGAGSPSAKYTSVRIAGRQDGRLARVLRLGEVAQRVGQHLGREHHPLPDFERSGGVRDSEGVERHGGGVRGRIVAKGWPGRRGKTLIPIIKPSEA